MRIKRLIIVLCLFLFVGCSDEEPTGPRVQLTQSTEASPLTGLESTTPSVIETRDYVLGNADAYVTIVMYGDFQCSRCARYARDLEILRTKYPDDVKIVWRQLPDTQSNPLAGLAFQATEAAAAQGRFWDMHAILYTTQTEWTTLSEEAFRQKLIDYARIAGLDTPRFTQEIADGLYAPLIEDYRVQADALGIVGIPALVVNGDLLKDRDDLFGLEGAIQLALLTQHHFDAPPVMTLDIERDYQAVIVTEKGEIRLDLYEKEAPITVNNFVFLAEQGWYNNTTFHIVIPDFYAQAGDPSNTGRGYPGYRIPREPHNGYIFDREGIVAMSHPPGEPENAGSQFFITVDVLPNHEAEWDGQYTIFGVVTAGLEIVRDLTPRNPGDPLRFPNPPAGDKIIEVQIEVR